MPRSWRDPSPADRLIGGLKSGRLRIVPLVLLVAPLCAHAAGFVLKSTDFRPGGALSARYEYNHFGCHGGNISPALSWSGTPAGTRSYVLTVFDRDAVHVNPHGWWHWVVFDIPPQVTGLKAGARPPAGAIEGKTDFGTLGYGGPCPPRGDGKHHYVFTLYALKRAHLPLPAAASGAEVSDMARRDALASAQIVATFSR